MNTNEIYAGKQGQFYIAPAKIDKRGPLFHKADVTLLCERSILNNTFFERHRKRMTADTQIAIDKTNDVTNELAKTLDKFTIVQDRFVDQSKRAAGSVRDASEKLAIGLSRVEKAANFDRLERYVELLERAASAMKSLAEIEATGKLEKIAAAIR